MDIDDILRAAETRDSDDHPQTIGEELLSQFKVQHSLFVTLFAFVKAVHVANRVALSCDGAVLTLLSSTPNFCRQTS